MANLVATAAKPATISTKVVLGVGAMGLLGFGLFLLATSGFSLDTTADAGGDVDQSRHYTFIDLGWFADWSW